MLAKEEAMQAILEGGVVAIVRLDSAVQLVSVAEAIHAGGVRAIEFTMTTPNAIEMLEEAGKRLPSDTVLGAGTVLDAQTARQVILAGAKFIVAPTLDLETIQLAHRYSVAVMPGAFTPTEIKLAWERGADLVKLFPASVGGPDYMKAILAPLPQVKILPTGGVDLDTAADFIRAGAAALAVGGNLVDKAAVKRGDFDQLTKTAQEFADIVRRTREEVAQTKQKKAVPVT
jgi:2-dehydro-3-deoxyphosphogluconate aldolase/(4S)-4-hydroxy-2-oxoglutarate aldolase